MRRVDELIEHCVELFGVSRVLLLGHSQKREIVAARSALMYALVELRKDLTMQEITERLGLTDRKSVYNGVRRAAKYMKQSADYHAKVEQLLDPRTLPIQRMLELLPPAPEKRLRARPRNASTLPPAAQWARVERRARFVVTA